MVCGEALTLITWAAGAGNLMRPGGGAGTLTAAGNGAGKSTMAGGGAGNPMTGFGGGGRNGLTGTIGSDKMTLPRVGGK